MIKGRSINKELGEDLQLSSLFLLCRFGQWPLRRVLKQKALVSSE